MLKFMNAGLFIRIGKLISIFGLLSIVTISCASYDRAYETSDYELAYETNKNSVDSRNENYSAEELAKLMYELTGITLTGDEHTQFVADIENKNQAEKQALYAHIVTANNKIVTVKNPPACAGVGYYYWTGSSGYIVPDGMNNLQFMQYLLTTST